MSITVNCPTCGRQVRWERASTWRPFCSERCRLIDLGDWLDESHRISEPADGHIEDGWGGEPQEDETAGRPPH